MNKINIWIRENRVKWCYTLFMIGVIGGFAQVKLLGGSLKQAVLMAFIYGGLLVVVELILGGSGAPDY